MIRKRTILALCAYVFSSLLTFAQTPSQRPYRIGLLSDTTYFSERATALQWDAGEQLAGLRLGMKDLGVVEGKDWVLIPRIANRDHALLDKYAAELVAMKADVIVASSTTAAIAAHQATRSIPIVAWAATLGDTVPTGKGSNITGFKGSDEVDEHLKQLQMVVPGLKRVAVLYDTSYAVVPALLEKAKTAAKAAALQLIFVEVKDDESLAPAFDRMVNENAQALLVLNHPRFHLHPQEAPTLALKYRLPMVSPYRESAEAGGLIAHHPDWQATWRRGAKVIKQILDGTPPGEIPGQTGVMRNYINVKTANALGLTIPESLRAKSELIGADADQITPMALPQNTAADEAAIRAIVAENTEAFNRQDPAGTVAHRTEAFDHINVAGVWTTSKAQLEEGMIDYFQTHHPTMTTSVEKIRFLTTDVAYAIVKRQYKDEKGTRDAISTSVFQKINGKWWDAAFQNTFIQPPAQRIASTHQEPASVEQEIKQLEEQRRQSLLRNDAASMERLLGDEFVVTDVRGQTYNKAEEISFIREGRRHIQKWELTDSKVRLYGEIAVVNERAHVVDTGLFSPDERRDVQLRLTHVWVKRDSKWQLVASHVTQILDRAQVLAQNPAVVIDRNSLQEEPRESGAEREILAHWEQMRQAYLQGDVAALNAILPDDWVHITGWGEIRTKPQVLADFSSGTRKGSALNYQGRKIRVYGDVAVVTGTVTITTTVNDQPSSAMQRFTSVLVKNAQGWQAVSNQASPPIQIAAGQQTSLHESAAGRDVSYQSGDETVHALLYTPPGAGPFPALIAIHAIGGLDDWVKQQASKLADAGYATLAVDLYRGKAASDLNSAVYLAQAREIARTAPPVHRHFGSVH